MCSGRFQKFGLIDFLTLIKWVYKLNIFCEFLLFLLNILKGVKWCLYSINFWIFANMIIKPLMCMASLKLPLSRGRLKFQYSTLVFSYNLRNKLIIQKGALMNTASSKHQFKVRNLYTNNIRAVSLYNIQPCRLKSIEIYKLQSNLSASYFDYEI